MKRHLNTLLQRKRVEPEDSSDMQLSTPNPIEAVALHVKDGYDWLQLIKQVRAQHAPAL